MSVDRNHTDHGPRLGSVLWLAPACLFAAGVYLWVARIKYVNGRMSLYDLGVFEQAIWTFLKTGRPTDSIVIPGTIFNWLGFHFSPVVLAASAIQGFTNSSFGLVVVQALLVSSAAIPVYRCCRFLQVSKAQSQWIAALMLAHPFVFNGATWDFHEVAIATPVLAWAIYWVFIGR